MGDFISQLKILMRSVVVKRDKVAAAFETDLEQRKAADRYINAIDNGDKWESYVRFDYDVIVAAGIDKVTAQFYVADKEKIPRELRQKIVNLERQYIIDNYEERNDYYLMLHGEPPIEDVAAYYKWVEEQQKYRPDPKVTNPYVYCPENDYGIPTDIPIHEMAVQYISLMESLGIIDQLMTTYPNKKYLGYLGRKAISYYNARTANNFGLLFAETSGIEPVIREDFVTFYDKARSYYLMGFYNKEYSNMFVWYDEFIGLLILTMAVQRLISNIYKQGLTRDFYDVNLIKYLFKSYSIPYIEDLDLRYQRALAKNLNHLLQYKATDKVLYDISYLLGFYDVNIYKYYLMKTHVLDEEGIPVFPKKTYKQNGEWVVEPDYEKMYRFHFQQVNLKEPDVNSALIDKRNRHEYIDIITQDPYWVDDYELKQKIYKNDFNHLVTKYMSVDVMIKMVEMLYEITHTVRLVIDDQEDFKRTMLNIPTISPHDTSLFDFIIFMCALIAHKSGLPGTVPIKGYQIANVYGFNYTQNIDALVHAIYDTKDLVAGEVLYAKDTMSFYTVIPNDSIKIPNHFKNQYSGTDTSSTVKLSNPYFRVLPVERVTQVPESPVENTYYNIVSPDAPLYCYNRYFEWVQVSSVPKTIDGVDIPVKEVSELPKYGEQSICYKIIQPDTLLYLYKDGVFTSIDFTVVQTLAFNLIDNNLASYIKNLRAVEAKDLGVMYRDLKTLRQFIVKMMEETDNIDVYQQYARLYKALLVTEDVQELYRDNNGKVRKTFADLLQSINPDLYTIYLRDIDNEKELNNDVNSVLSKMSSFGEFTYLANINRADSMFDIVLRLIRFFKSYTVDFVNSGIQYVLDDKYFHGIKLLDEWVLSSTGFDIKDAYRSGRYYKDLIQYLQPNIDLRDYTKLVDKEKLTSILWIFDHYMLNLHDRIFIGTELDKGDAIQYYDLLGLSADNVFMHSRLNLSDYAFIHVMIDDIINNDRPDIHDMCWVRSLIDNISDDNDHRVLNIDTESMDINHIFIQDRLPLQDKVRYTVNYLS
jgi:hypothetical protein